MILSEKDHNILWRTIDLIAKSKNINLSKMAKASGIDYNSVSKHKRFNKYGKQRVLHMVTTKRILDALGLTWHDWASFWDQATAQCEIKEKDVK